MIILEATAATAADDQLEVIMMRVWVESKGLIRGQKGEKFIYN